MADKQGGIWPLRVYVETSVFGFVLDNSEVNQSKRRATERMFKQFTEGTMHGYISSVVIAELLATPHAKSREVLLSMAERLVVLPTPDMRHLDFLVDAYMQNQVFPPDKRDDAVHVAYVVLNPQIETMVSWNCRHLANEFARRRLKAVTLSEGYPFHFEIATPEEVLIYE